MNKKYLQEMLEALISDDTEKAAEYLHKNSISRFRKLVLGEKHEEEEEEDKEEEEEKKDKKEAEKGKHRKKDDDNDDNDDNDDDEDDDDDDEEVDESLLDQIDESLLDEIYTIVTEKKPSAGLSKKKKSEIVKKAKKGEDIGKKGKKFAEIAKKAAKRYGSVERGRKVAAAAMWKNVHEDLSHSDSYEKNEKGESYTSVLHKDNSRKYNNPKGTSVKADPSSGMSAKLSNAYKTAPHKDNSRKAKSEDKGTKGLHKVSKVTASPDGDGSRDNRRTDKAKKYHGTSRDGKDLK